ncbi:uncharacterized protein LOC127852428 [Dreissena polymorpha]|uniref:uncharacterized protein LOC127852428 n=1 Tax=Dreissena polymorpha TaxID=45954 RepID=UPI002263EAF8|nr:uncharacterized protein LOC127852428 [Dreissena polymorpha]
MGCWPISSRLISIRLRATPFNITIIQAYAPTTDYSDEVVEFFCEQLQEVINQTPKKHILVVQGDWNATVGEDAYKSWKGKFGQHCNIKSNERGLRLLVCASNNELMLTNKSGSHKPSRRQIYYIMMKKRFRSGVNVTKTRSFPGSDIGSDQELVLKTFKLHLKTANKLGPTRNKFDLERLTDPEVAKAFQAQIGGKFAALTILDAVDTDTDTLIDTVNTAVTETASEILGKHRSVKKTWVTADVLNLCDKRRDLKKIKNDTEGANHHKSVNHEIKKSMKRAKENWIEEQCQDIDDSLKKKQQKRLPTGERSDQHKARANHHNTRQRRKVSDGETRHLKEVDIILLRTLQLQNHGRPRGTECPFSNQQRRHPILRVEVEAIKSLKKGKSAWTIFQESWYRQGGRDNQCFTDHLQQDLADGGVAHTVDIVSYHHPPKERHLQLCQNCITISLISQPSKVMLKILLNIYDVDMENEKRQNISILTNRPREIQQD